MKRGTRRWDSTPSELCHVDARDIRDSLPESSLERCPLWYRLIMSTGAYLTGRPLRPLGADPTPVEDSLYAAERLDESEIAGKTFRHCTFANISFKGCTLKDCHFIDCVFVDCYFRNAKIDDCTFSASKFIDCNLTKIDFRTSDVKYYNSFSGCFIPYHEIVGSLPSEGNLRAHLCANLATEARDAGAWADSEKFRQDAAESMERHLWAAVRHSSAFYREKYRGSVRFGALVDLTSSKTRGLVWGYRRSHFVVLRNWLVITLVVFPLLFGLLRDGVTRKGQLVTWQETWLASVGNMLPGSGISDVEFASTASQAVAFVEVLFGLLFVGLVVTLLFRAAFERRQ